jgi:hypothetical protein
MHLVGTFEEVSTGRHGTEKFKILSGSLKEIRADLKHTCVTSDSCSVTAAKCEKFFYAR